uniref:Ig-like domain-containing protein n=1 Tax=Oncorhynchus kisutch TaxID=8019 RepID=A0A8C7D0W3_ONCKI
MVNKLKIQFSHRSDQSELTFSWYKQPFGNIPRVMSTFFYKYDSGATFYHEFKGNPRFSVENMELSDSALYYCGSAYGNKVDGVCQTMRHSENPSSHKIVCSVRSVWPTNGYEHSVYWFRHGSGESRPGIIYTHGDRSDQCEKSSEAESSTQSCVYNLPKRNLSPSDAGTYYCAVASCGEIILFGNGIKLDVECGHSDDPQMRILVLLSVIRTGGLLCCLTIFIIIYTTRK